MSHCFSYIICTIFIQPTSKRAFCHGWLSDLVCYELDQVILGRILVPHTDGQCGGVRSTVYS